MSAPDSINGPDGPGSDSTAIPGRNASARPGAPALWIGGAVAALVSTLLVLAGAHVFEPHALEPRVRRFAIAVPELIADPRHPVRISPDGLRLVYSSGARVMVRDLAQFEPREVMGAENAGAFAWSPDSRRIVYFKHSKLWVANPDGADAAGVCELPAGDDVSDADWGPDETIVFASTHGGLYLVPAAGGGTPRMLLKPGERDIEFLHPQFLPDGRHVLAVARRADGLNAAIAVSYPEGAVKSLGEFEHLAAARYDPSGHLLLTYESGVEGTRVVPFSAQRLEISGPPLTTLPGAACPSVSRDGTLAYTLDSSRRQPANSPDATGDPGSAIYIVENWARELPK